MPSGANISDLIVVGAGASGLMCAAQAAGRGLRVTVLDRSDTAARKLRASGGGRCNFTNLHASASRYQCGNPDFPRSALARYKPAAIIDYVRLHGLGYEEREDGMMFLTVSAVRLADALLADCRSRGVRIVLGRDVQSISNSGAGFLAGAHSAPRIVIATGGPAWPSLGASGFGHDVARQFGHTVTEIRPGLVPLKLPRGTLLDGLSGLSFRASLTANGRTFTGDVLVTHIGISGPAALRVSSHWRPGDPLTVGFMGADEARAWLSEHQGSGRKLSTLLAGTMPRRLAERLAAVSGLSQPLNAIGKKERAALEALLASYALRPSGAEGMAHAEVTVGGVDTREVSSKTMESRKVEGLYFIGEVLDVAGDLGGFNLHWAWASAHAAASSM